MSRGFAVLGAGSWGTALALHLGRIGHEVSLWARDATLAQEIQRTRHNSRYLSECELPAAVRCTSDLAVAVEGAQFVVFALPPTAQY